MIDLGVDHRMHQPRHVTGELLEQAEAQQHRQRPQLGERGVVTLAKLAGPPRQQLPVDQAVAVTQEREAHELDPPHARVRADFDPREPALELAGEAATDLPGRAAQHKVIVEHPLDARRQ